MKSFATLEEQEKKIKSEAAPATTEKTHIPLLPIILAVLALIILVVVFIKLFLPSKQAAQDTSAKNYEIEIDGKRYSADSLEELSEMVGFDVSTFFNDNTKEKTTKVEDKLYENGELATIETEYGTYKFGVTDAILLRESPLYGGKTWYQITYIVENVDFDNGDGNGVSLFPDDLTVTDSDGNTCDMPSVFTDDEVLNPYDMTTPGKKTEKKTIYAVNNQECQYLDIYFATRGVTCQIPISNLEEYCNDNKVQEIGIGTAFTISDSSGKMTLTVDDARIDNSLVLKSSADSDMLVIDFDIDNISYDVYGSGTGVDGSYALMELISATDNNNYTLRQTEYYSGSGDGKYSYIDTIKPGAKGRLAIIYEVEKGTEYVILDFQNGTTLKIDL